MEEEGEERSTDENVRRTMKPSLRFPRRQATKEDLDIWTETRREASRGRGRERGGGEDEDEGEEAGWEMNPASKQFLNLVDLSEEE